MTRLRVIGLIVLILIPSGVLGSSGLELADGLILNGFIDGYYADDVDSQGTRSQEYLTQPKVSDELRLNIANLSLGYDRGNFYSKLSLQYGDSVNVNYSAEDKDGTKYIQESYIGYKLTDALKIDAGIYLSHIGLESFNTYLNPAYTRSFVSEFSPYYQSGIRLSYEYSSKLSFQFHVLNGWQNISKFDGGAAFGTQALYKSEEGYQVSYNTFVGKESDYERYFNDFVFTIPVSEKLNLYIVADLGFQHSENLGDTTWTGYLGILEYKLAEDLSLVGRLEHYQDQDGTIVTTVNGKPFSSFAYSMGVSYALLKGLLLRTEVRRFDATNEIYDAKNDIANETNTLVTSSISYNF
jgi:hypothetical protein